jgi:hypothetical protein
MLRDHFFLSIEPLSSSDDDDDDNNTGKPPPRMGPAFFGTSVKNDDSHFDPAMCPLELAFVMATIPKQTMTTPTTDGKKTFQRSFLSPKVKEPTELKESTVLMYIDEKAYQVDLEQIENVEVELDNDDATSKPPCLLIQFSVGTFRIFSLQGDSADQFSALNAVKTRLIHLLTSSDIVSPFPSSSATAASVASPGGSSAFSSSNEPGQKEFSHPAPVPSERNERPEEGESSTTEEPSTEQQALLVDRATASEAAVTEHCQAAYAKARLDLESLTAILERREPSSRLLRDQVHELLTSVPDHLASSYCTTAQLVHAVQNSNKRIGDYHVEMDGILQRFWPNHPKRARLSERPSAADRRPQIPAEDCIARTQELLKKHREAVRAKYSLYLLPNRG